MSVGNVCERREYADETTGSQMGVSGVHVFPSRLLSTLYAATLRIELGVD